MNSIFRLTALLLLCVMAASVTGQAQDLYDETTVRDIELTFSQSNWWSLLYQNMQPEICIEADMTVDGVTYPRVGVRFKGNSSASVWPAEKMPFKIKTDEFIPGQDLYGYDTINLGNSFMDPTFMREVVTYHILRNYMPASKANFVRLWLNGTYWGIYVNTEQVSGELLEEWFEDKDGNRYKCDPTGHGGSSSLTWLGSSPSNYYSSYELKSDPTGTEWYDLIDMIDVLNNRPVSVQWTELAPKLFIDRCIWYVAGCNLFANLDSYIGSRHNYYMYNDPYEGRFSPIPWDTNEAFGNFSLQLSPTQLQRIDPFYNYGNSSYPLITRLLSTSSDIRGRQTYLAHLRDMVNADWNWTHIGGLVQQYQNLIEQDVINDTKKLYSLSYFYSNVTQDVRLGNRTSCGLQPFVENRRSYLLGLSSINAPYPQLTGTSITPAQPGPTDDVLVKSSVSLTGATLGDVDLYYRTAPDSLYQQLALHDDGQHGDGAAGDGVFGNWIPAQPGSTIVQYFILAQTTSRVVGLDPIYGEGNPFSYKVEPPSSSNGVFINEFLAKNNSTIQDPAGSYEDYVELYNSNAATVDLSGMYMTDNLGNPTKWQIPAGTSIGPGQTLLIWADEDLIEGPLHADFKLSAGGEEIGFFDTDGITLLDCVIFGAQVADVSTGLLEDGKPLMVTFPVPTPDDLNDRGSGLRSYDQLDPLAHSLNLAATGTGSIGTTVTFIATNLKPNVPAKFLWGGTPKHTTLTSLVLLVQPAGNLNLKAGAAGTLTLPIAVPLQPGLVGKDFFFQVAGYDSLGGVSGSNAIHVTISQ